MLTKAHFDRLAEALAFAWQAERNAARRGGMIAADMAMIAAVCSRPARRA